MKGQLSISRVTSTQEDAFIYISIEDAVSHIEFLTIKMSIEEYGNAISGLAVRPIEFEVHGLEYVGMKCVTEKRSIRCPFKTHRREDYRKWLEENAQEDGWVVSTYLGSQNSVVRDANGTTLNYTVTKFVREG